ncbi:MAG: pyruvate dehydrogenase (acetyl-transferring), homodimeric type [Cellulomonadaceae bacterium]|jgi:pyruvate dehydrogenase E1 component|nr:pyruvate dehydrogenase (acetyl-transferring), homodimeric type [Cellulomonadaceae bacterium]
MLSTVPDIDPQETEEWVDSFDGLVDDKGGPRARYVMLNLLRRARERNVSIPHDYATPYVNTIGVHEEPYFPGDENMERLYRRLIRWNAAVMVTKAQRPGLGVGGHISSYASLATLYEVGLNHFFRGKDHPGGGDQIFWQGHSSPGNYARAFLEGRLSEKDLDGFRQEKSENGLSSYPHPHNMPEFWEFPTVSLGLGPIGAIYQAWINRYLHNRGIKDTSQQDVWCFVGDGETDEVETRGAIQWAAYQQLDNLTFVINCNLQRLDGPVRGDGKIIQELEAQFKGAGWNVIKVIWGREWDALLNADKDRALVHLMNDTLDGDYQTYRAESGAYIREQFFDRDPRTAKLVAGMSDHDIWNLKRGGHDYRKVYAAYAAARAHTGAPTVILAQTVKGWNLGEGFEAKNSTHQMKKLTSNQLKDLRDRLQLPIPDEALEDPYNAPYYHPGFDDPVIKYMLDRRKKLGGFLPLRKHEFTPLPMPSDKPFASLATGSKRDYATTMAVVRLFKDLMKEPGIGERFVPIVPDEARTFGMESIFPTARIFNTLGMQYTAVDSASLMKYVEATDGQMLHTGITEAGSVAAFNAAGSAYSTHGEALIPWYIFYSMFGFQRVGDSFWQAADQLVRGFIVGATAGRTTLTGEGLQHADGQSPLLASPNRAVITYDPAYAYEIRHIVRDGIERMYGQQSPDDLHDAQGRSRDVMYYLTVYNEPVPQPAEPSDVDVDGILKGIHHVASDNGGGPRAQLLASGVAVPWALEAQRLLRADWGVSADVWSVTSWNELRRDAIAADQDAFLHPGDPIRTPYLTAKLAGADGPFIATSDYDRLVPDMIRKWVPGEYEVLGADGFGFSDTRPAARRFFKIDGPSMVVKTLQTLARRGEVDPGVVAQAIERYQLHNVNAGASGNEGGDG